MMYVSMRCKIHFSILKEIELIQPGVGPIP